jgi:hypothetical protein
MITDRPTDTDSPEVDNATPNGDDKGMSQPNETQATQQAQEILDGIQDQPDVQEALYELLQEQFDPTPQPEEAPSPKGTPAMMDTEGMPQ